MDDQTTVNPVNTPVPGAASADQQTASPAEGMNVPNTGTTSPVTGQPIPKPTPDVTGEQPMEVPSTPVTPIGTTVPDSTMVPGQQVEEVKQPGESGSTPPAPVPPVA